MFISSSLSVNEKGNLTMGGADTLELAKEFGTPLYVIDENNVCATMHAYKDTFEKEYEGNGMVFYASKAFCTKDMCRIAHREGLGLDIVSGGEMYTALSAGVPASLLCFHGNNKDDAEITDAINAGIGRIVADSVDEIIKINEIAGSFNKKQKILIRVKPGVEAHTHEFIMTGQIDSKFGVSLETGEALDAILKAAALPNIDMAGVHCHIGSQIFECDPFKLAVSKMIGLIASAGEKGVNLYELDMGGGFGIRYTSSDAPRPYSEYAGEIIKTVKEEADKAGINRPFLMIEPGRSIIGEAGITLYKIGQIKDIPGIRKYVSVNGGMADNPRYIMYEAEYSALIASRPLDTPTEKVTVSGKSCESGDILMKDVMMPPAKSGEILAVLSTGAYNYSMSSNYNRLPRPAVVTVKDGTARLTVKRETYEDIIRNDL